MKTIFNNNTFRETKTGNYLGYCNGYYIFIYRRPHGKWCGRIGVKGKWLWREGYHGTSLPTLKDAKRWARLKIRRFGAMGKIIN